jgi:hypothetical protein
MNDKHCPTHGWLSAQYWLDDGRCALCVAEEKTFNHAVRQLRAALDELWVAIRAAFRGQG